MRTTITTRRDLFRALGPAALLLMPVLRARRARAAAPPKFLAVYFPNGPSGDANTVFFPDRGPGGWSWTGKFTEPLEGFSSYATVIRRQALNRGEHNFDQGYHGAGIVTWLTGTDEMNYANGTDHHSSKTHSLDQHIARHTGTTALYTAVGRGKQRVASVSYLGDDKPNTPEQDPERAYARIFQGGLTACDAAALVALKSRARRDQLVLDRIRGDLTAARRSFGLGKDEVDKLAAYEEALSSIEARLRRDQEATSCPSRAAVAPPSFADKSKIPQAIRLHSDVMALALALTDLRAGVIQWFHDSNDQEHSGWLPVTPKGHHKLQHEGPDAQKNCRLIMIWFSQQLAYLLGKMKSLQVGGETLLDQSIVLFGTDNPKGIGTTSAHRFSFDYGQLVFGRGAGRLKAGQDIDLGRRVNHVTILGTIAKAMGVDTKHYEQRKGWQGFVDGMLA
jgi:hypothetical protein